MVKTESSIDIVKKVTYVYLMETKAVVYPPVFQRFLFNVMIIRYFNTLDMVESGYSWT